jgi:hypothetical protein
MDGGLEGGFTWRLCGISSLVLFLWRLRLDL